MYLYIYVSMYLNSYPCTQAIYGLAAGSAWEQFGVRLTMMTKWTQRYTPRPWWSKFGDALWGGNPAYLERHLQAVIEWTLVLHSGIVSERVWRGTWRPWSSKFGNALGGHDRVNLEVVIMQVRRYNWRPWSSEFGDAPGGHDQASLEICTWRPWLCKLGARNGASLQIHFAAVIEGDWTSTWRRSMDSTPSAESRFIS